ncbi:uncharacterized protein N7506_000654 [Penicillium brevicompactum]|uniref:uncharacterized protein n=1 Tax=Penicillium brevicompactum TaxID=5074 RepID=UPI0025419CF0|nr:uncharacterized protein N7506_000654 [Penicillium brevicompactum]KAJ5347401.1 hypothetical protein N7506_000654 [Penicillium brevicompactum]
MTRVEWHDRTPSWIQRNRERPDKRDTTQTQLRRIEKETISNQVPAGFGTTFGYLWWYGFHLPRVRERDVYYTRLEAERAAERS